MFPQEFHQQTAALRDLSFGLGAGMMPMFDSGMFIPPPPGFAASSPIVAKTRGRGRRGRGRLRGRGVMAAEGVEKGVAMGGVRRGGRGRGGRGSRSRAAEMMKTLTEKYLQVGSVVVMVVSVYLGSRPVKSLVPDVRLQHLVAISRPPAWDTNLPFSCILPFYFCYRILFNFKNLTSSVSGGEGYVILWIGVLCICCSTDVSCEDILMK